MGFGEIFLQLGQAMDRAGKVVGVVVKRGKLVEAVMEINHVGRAVRVFHFAPLIFFYIAFGDSIFNHFINSPPRETNDALVS